MKGAVQLCNYRSIDRNLCFHIRKKQILSFKFGFNSHSKNSWEYLDKLLLCSRGRNVYVLWSVLPNWSGIKLCVTQCKFWAVFCLY